MESFFQAFWHKYVTSVYNSGLPLYDKRYCKYFRHLSTKYRNCAMKWHVRHWEGCGLPYGIRSEISYVFIVVQWTISHSSLNHNESIPYPVWKCLPYGSSQLLNVIRDTAYSMVIQWTWVKHGLLHWITMKYRMPPCPVMSHVRKCAISTCNAILILLSINKRAGLHKSLSRNVEYFLPRLFCVMSWICEICSYINNHKIELI